MADKTISELSNSLTAALISDASAVDMAAEMGSTSYKITLSELRKATSDVFNVLDYGATGNGSDDDTASIQSAIDAAEAYVVANSTGAQVLFPPGTYAHTGLTVNQNAIWLRGSGEYATTMKFTSSSGTGIALTKGVSILFNCRISDMTVRCEDTSSGSKIAISISDASQTTISNVCISQCQGGDSVGIVTYGREMLTLRDVYIYATVPVRFRANPNDTSTYIAADHFNFHNCYFWGHATAPATLTQAILLIDDVYVSNFSTTGYQAWINQKHGLYYSRSTTSRPVTHNMLISNIRFEQASDNTGYNVYIDFTTNSLQGQDIRIVNCKGSSENNGLYLRYCRDVLVDGYSKSGTLDSLNVDRVSTLTARALLISNGADSINMSNMRLAHGTRPADNTYDYIVDGVWHYETAATLYDSKPTKHFEADTWSWAGTLADDGLQQLPLNSDTQKWLVARIEAMAMNAANDVLEHGTWIVGDVSSHATKGVDKVSGTTNTAAGNSDGSLCIYCNGTNPLEAPIYLYNRLGYECTVVVSVVGKRDSSGL